MNHWNTLLLGLLAIGLLVPSSSFSAGLLKQVQSAKNIGKIQLCASPNVDNNDEGTDEKTNKLGKAFDVESNKNRRMFFRDGGIAATSSAASALGWASIPLEASADNPKSRTEGYAVQHTEREWAYLLSGPQYNILRRGGTERQKSSILNTYTSENVGTYICAGCQTPLFESSAKFNSRTGWPSFAKALEGVEEEELDAFRATLAGREVRCATCGGHLGDLFNDGWIYAGTQAFETGNRYCIDGAALIFKPSGGGEDVYGDTPPPNKAINYEPSIFRDNSINSRVQ